MKLSTHVRAFFGLAVVVFIGTFIKQPQTISWLQAHPYSDAISTALGSVFTLWNSYSSPTQNT